MAPAVAHAAPAISISPAGTVAFGDQDILATPVPSQHKTVTVYSTGNANLVIGDPILTGSTAFYKVQDNCSGQTLPPSQLCTIVLGFDPEVVGPYAATLTVPSNVGVTTSVDLSGNGVASPVFSPDPTSHGFGDIDVFAGTPGNGFFRITNAGSAPMNISSVSVTGTGAANFTITSQNCTGVSIPTSGYCDVEARFDPLTGGNKEAFLHFVHNGVGGSSDITMTGKGIHAKFSPVPGSLAFGNQSASTGSTTKTVTVTNSGDHPMTISYTELEGTNASDFAIVETAANTCDDGPVAIGASCDLPVQFDPASSGVKSASLRVWHNDPTTTPTSGQSTIALGGTGTVSQATVSPGDVGFDARDIFSGPSPNSTVTVTNSGSEVLTVNSAAITEDLLGEFAITGGTCTVSPPKVLAIGESCTYTVRFDPSDDGEPRAANLEIQHSGINSPSTVVLAGQGLEPQLGVFPGDLQFDSRLAAAGVSEPKWVRFENYGSGPLSIGELGITGPDAAEYAIYFSDCANRTLVPTEFCDVAITFDPQSAGAKSATLRMTHTSLPHTTTELALTGSATEPPPLKITVTNPKRLRLRTTKTITYTIKCPATCTVTANANLLLPVKGKKVKRSTLGWKQITVKGGKTGKLTFKLAGGQRVALANAARARKKVSVSASFSAWAVGYSEAVATRGFKLK